jgi:protein-S-isoprenylcysteine O-methyltransferase Ste14
MNTTSLIIFSLTSIPLIYISRKTILNIRSHGFYRFFSWECILWLFASNYSVWFDNPFSVKQIISWILLIYSIYPLLAGVILLKKAKNKEIKREESELYAFEKTTELVDTGIYKYVRHPLYSSLLFLTWGIYLKNTTLILGLVAIASSLFLYITARMDEKECIEFFGEKYRTYMQRSKMFIPLVV